MIKLSRRILTVISIFIILISISYVGYNIKTRYEASLIDKENIEFTKQLTLDLLNDPMYNWNSNCNESNFDSCVQKFFNVTYIPVINNEINNFNCTYFKSLSNTLNNSDCKRYNDDNIISDYQKIIRSYSIYLIKKSYDKEIKRTFYTSDQDYYIRIAKDISLTMIIFPFETNIKNDPVERLFDYNKNFSTTYKPYISFSESFNTEIKKGINIEKKTKKLPSRISEKLMKIKTKNKMFENVLLISSFSLLKSEKIKSNNINVLIHMEDMFPSFLSFVKSHHNEIITISSSIQNSLYISIKAYRNEFRCQYLEDFSNETTYNYYLYEKYKCGSITSDEYNKLINLTEDKTIISTPYKETYKRKFEYFKGSKKHPKFD